MPDPRHERLRRLFDRALELPALERKAFLDRECADDAALKQRIVAMLAASQDERFLSAPPGSRVEVYYEMMREAAATKTTAEWMKICAENSIPAMRANELSNVFEDPHLKATGFFEMREIEGEGRYRAMRPGIRFANTPSSIRFDPPKIGEHTDEIMREVGD